LAGLTTWLAVAFLTRYSSLAALATAVLAPLYAWLLSGRAIQPTQVVAVIAVLVIFRHRANIARLIRGEESKIELKKKTS
jgi:glycerol-3-phosphate acyltransferase PlsY